MEQPISILVVDDDEAAREFLLTGLGREGYRLQGAASAEEALDLMAAHPFDLVITDVQMGGMNGIELVKQAREKYPTTLWIVVTAFGDSDVTISAIRAGAFDFITKPFQIDKARRLVANAAAKQTLLLEQAAEEPVATLKSSSKQIVGQSEKMIEVFKLIGRVANTESTVLIMGESGTGKELAAWAIHNNSFRRDKQFIAINCGAIPEPLLESELFGYEKGAFTGAEKAHIGILESVNGGTCLLDEIGEMPLAMQSKLLRFLQDGEVRRVGSSRVVRVDVRVLSSTNRDLEEMVQEGKFREDLYYRLNVVRLVLPPLRERREDIPLLAEYFLGRYCTRNRRPGVRFSKETMNMLLPYSWPGNVRELENVVDSAATLSPTNVIGTEVIPAKIRSASVADTFLEKTVPEVFQGDLLPMAEVERLYIMLVLKEVGNNKSLASRVLGLDRKTLRLKLKQYGYDAGDDKE